ncbi:hypothetical protein C0J52_22100 [Blattella germanica]|nr:hypothetical protein C0J52_22100 [Blattella germanica]
MRIMASVVKVSSRIGAALYWAPTSTLVSRNKTSRSYYTYSPEPAQPLNKDPKWVSAKEAVQCIQSGSLLDEKRSRKPQTSENDVERIQQAIERSPDVSTHRLSNELDIFSGVLSSPMCVQIKDNDFLHLYSSGSNYTTTTVKCVQINSAMLGAMP